MGRLACIKRRSKVYEAIGREVLFCTMAEETTRFHLLEMFDMHVFLEVLGMLAVSEVNRWHSCFVPYIKLFHGAMT